MFRGGKMLHKINFPDNFEKIDNKDICSLHNTLAIHIAEQVNQAILNELYKIYKDKVNDLIVIDESEFEQFLRKYLPIYMKKKEGEAQ